MDAFITIDAIEHLDLSDLITEGQTQAIESLDSSPVDREHYGGGGIAPASCIIS
ncbi:hypothetical protein M378DRAFT_163418 [Amanita muscaria Koide BX008]|uniref:Pheromone n=1 Tax=Amanita muscaria (strain Koide BX008) TaxID=946122 RepID=A0A0C2X535_AMAMK|nr:hypothetical protein M378DRAFT_163418 [Amanita muscaria Koide BX008]